MHHFLIGTSVRESKVNRRSFQEAKKTLLERFCEWYETTAHESSANTLFDVQKLMEEFQDDWNKEVYTLITINRKLKVKYGDSLRFTPYENWPSIMSLHEEVNQIVLESLLDTVSNSLTLRKIWKTSFSLAKRLDNVCKKAVNVSNSILIQWSYSRKPFRSHSKEIIIFPRCYIYEVKNIYWSRKEKLAKGHRCSRDHAMVQKRRVAATTSACYIFVHSSDHKIMCSGWCSVRTGTFVIILDYIRFRVMWKRIHNRIHWFAIWRRVDGMLPSVHRR